MQLHRCNFVSVLQRWKRVHNLKAGNDWSCGDDCAPTCKLRVILMSPVRRLEQNGSDRTVCTTRLPFLDASFGKLVCQCFFSFETVDKLLQYQLRFYFFFWVFNSGCKQRANFLCLTKILRFWMIKCATVPEQSAICVAFFLSNIWVEHLSLFCSSKNFFSFWSKLNQSKVLNPENTLDRRRPRSCLCPWAPPRASLKSKEKFGM